MICSAKSRYKYDKLKIFILHMDFLPIDFIKEFIESRKKVWENSIHAMKTNSVIIELSIIQNFKNSKPFESSKYKNYDQIWTKKHYPKQTIMKKKWGKKKEGNLPKRPQRPNKSIIQNLKNSKPFESSKYKNHEQIWTKNYYLKRFRILDVLNYTFFRTLRGIWVCSDTDSNSMLS